ncbi:hypothetical protein [Caproicibacter fermentans]|nr:hypothetical protein [Caproicibacter fermentans]
MLYNLINDPVYREQIGKFRADLLESMEETKDPGLPAYREFVFGD